MAAEGYVQEHIEMHEKHLGRTLSFGKIGKMTMGKIGTILVDTSILITQFGFCTGYFIFLGSTARSVLFEFLHYHAFNASTINQSFPLIPTNSSLLANSSLYVTPVASLQQNITSISYNSTFNYNLISDNSTINNNFHSVIQKMKSPFTHKTLQENKPWTFALLLTIPAPLLILIAFIRDLRKLGPVSVLANGAITGAFLATGIYILVGK